MSHADCILESSFDSIVDGNFVAMAIATTGLRIYDGHKICCVSAVRYVNGRRETCFEELVNPHRDIPWEARKYNGIDEHKASLAADFYRVWLSFFQFANGYPIVVYSGTFVKDFIDNELTSDFPHPQLVDVMGMIEYDIGVRVSLLDAVRRMDADETRVHASSKVLKNAELLGLLTFTMLIKKGQLKEPDRLEAQSRLEDLQIENQISKLGDNISENLRLRSLDEVLNDQQKRLKADFSNRVNRQSAKNRENRVHVNVERQLMPKNGRDIYMHLAVELAQAYYGASMKVPVPGESKSVEIKISKWIRTGDTIKCVGDGCAGQNGGKPGNLFINVSIKTSSWYRLDGDDLHVTFPWSPGRSIILPELQLRVDVPIGYPLSEAFSVEGMGLAYRLSEQRGNLYIHDPEYSQKLMASKLKARHSAVKKARKTNVDFDTSICNEDKASAQNVTGHFNSASDDFDVNDISIENSCRTKPEPVCENKKSNKKASDEGSGCLVVFILIIMFIIYICV